jgi:pyrophosphatase PpaX
MTLLSTGKCSLSSGGGDQVIFDLDGTLVDNMELIVRSLNFAVSDYVEKRFSREEVYPLFGPTLEEIVAELVPSQRAGDAVQKYHDYYREHFHQLGHFYEGIPRLIDELNNAKIEMAICTASDERMTKTTLEQSGLQEKIPIVVTADDVTEVKPDPEGLLRALELMRGRPDRAMYLGDSVRDIEAAKRASIGSAAALWGFGDRADLEGCEPDFTFEKPLDLLHEIVVRPN